MEQRRMDYHLHTLHSMDGKQSMNELCQTAMAKGVQEICLTEHIEIGHPEEGMDVPPIWDVWFREVQQARILYPDLVIRAGVEIGDNPACREEIKGLLDELPLDFRLLSLHLVDNMDAYEKHYFDGKTRAEAYRRYVQAKLESVMAWDDFDSVAHIGYVAKYSAYSGEERPLRYEDAPEEFDQLLGRVIALDKCIEVNTSTYAAMGTPLPHPSIIRRYVELGGTCFTFGSDSHDTDRDYADVERAKELVRSLGGKYQASFHQRKKTCWRI